MTNTTLIPGALVAPVREGVYAASRDLAETIEHGEELEVCRDRLAGICRLLEVIGWTDEEPVRDTEVDLGVHAATLRAAVVIMLPILEVAAGEREQYAAMRDLATQLPEAPRWLEIRVEVVLLLRGILYAEVARASEELAEECTLTARTDVAEKLARFDRVRALLDAIGWGEGEQQLALEIDSGVHGQTLRDVLEADLELQLHLAATDDVSQREDATATAALIESFLAELDGTR